MATYGSLLIDAGGGVIDHRKQSDRQPGATVVIGLGGTGTDAVSRLKREVYKRLKPDDVDAVVPVYDNIKYLIIDSDETKVRASKGRVSDIDEGTEFFSIFNPNIKAAFAAKKIIKGRRELDWLDYEHISIDDASAGAGGIRQVGRFLLVDRAEHLYAKIKSTFQSALIGADGKLAVHICAGISGGTGSGTFLDVCYLVREAIKELGISQAIVCGYFFLPDVNISAPSIANNPFLSRHMSVNGFAALKELDYCMNYDKNRDSFKMNYGFKKIDNPQKPVDLCYLISATDQGGNIINDGYGYAMKTVSDYIVESLAKEQLPPGLLPPGIFLKGMLFAMLPAHWHVQSQHGAVTSYNALGISTAEMPLSEIVTYLGYKLFENYSDLYDRVPTTVERDDFLARTQLKYENIRKALTRGCPASINFPEELDVKMFKAYGNTAFVNCAEKYFAENIRKLRENAEELIEDIRDFSRPGNRNSLIERTYMWLHNVYVNQMAYGPFFARRMIYGSYNQNLVHAADGLIFENRRNLEAELRQDKLRNCEYEDAFVLMKNANLLNGKKKFENYLNALNNLYIHRYRIEELQTMDMVLETYREQLIKLNNNFFRVLTTVLDTLQDTFLENGKVLMSEVRNPDSHNWKILSVPEIISSLDKEVQNLNLNSTWFNLMNTMMNNCTKWITEDENEITKLISDFMLTTFSNTAQKTISDYLSVRFNVPKSHPHYLADCIERSIIDEKLEQKSTPLFWQNPIYHGAGMRGVLTVPYNSAEIEEAAHNYATKYAGFVIKKSGITDRISMMRFYNGLPMYAYQGLFQLQERYEQDNKPGRHLYECAELDWNEWLPSPIPASFQLEKPIARIEERNKKLLKEFEAAECLHIVQVNELGQWIIQKTEDFNVDAYMEQQGGYMTNGIPDIKKVEALVSDLETEKARLRLFQNVQPIRIEYGNAKAGFERQVMLDFYLKAPVLNQILHKELQKYEAIDNQIKQLKYLEDSLIRLRKERENFFQAVFTGVVSYENWVTYVYEESGEEQMIILQNDDMEYGDTGAYQAFLTYQTLSDAIKKKIVMESHLRMREDDDPKVRLAVEKLDANMEKRIERYKILHNKTDSIHDELEKFYAEFMKAFQAFKFMV